MQQIVTAMDPVESCWSVVFKDMVGRVPCLEKSLSFHSVPSWSFYLVSSVTVCTSSLLCMFLNFWLVGTAVPGQEEPQHHMPSMCCTGSFLLPMHSDLSRYWPIQKRYLAMGRCRLALAGRKPFRRRLRQHKCHLPRWP